MAVVIREYRIPTPNSLPYVITLDETESNVWFCEMGAGKIGRLSLTDYAITEFNVPTPNSQPVAIRSHPNGNMYFTEKAGNKIGRLSQDGSIVEFDVPTPNAGPDGMKLGPDGAFWFCENTAGKVARMTPDGVFTEFDVFPAGARPLVPTFVGDDVWFSDPAGRRMIKTSLTGKLLAVKSFPDHSPRSTILGPDGNIWFSLSDANAIGRMDKNGENIRYFPLPDTSARSFAWLGDELWFTNETRECVGHMDMDGKLLGEYFPPTPKGGLRSMTASRDGRLFFSEQKVGQIAELIP